MLPKAAKEKAILKYIRYFDVNISDSAMLHLKCVVDLAKQMHLLEKFY